ncbi:Retrovirus-related Pol polyprotein from transposon TNT 1-94 [Sesamum angolense]|uniref:Retrovirus-related Pol polyprotein from transposon TNT 1-94 n=1 Tax=Sesamum angolense TaxID=2727404 RepID=A0AAE1X2R2_9LAMI|nr:Retrovirus-related Pol polyprotein from transposon TNT 1-94 [Sesamum angolense]
MSKNIEENIDDFTKLVQDIKLTGDKNIDDYTPIVLLNVIPEVYSDVKAAIKYGRDNVSLDTVINGLKSKEMDIKTNKTSQSHNEVNMEEGLEGRWGKGIMKIMKGSLTVFKADRRRNLYVCSVDYDILAASMTDFDKTSLWHKRTNPYTPQQNGVAERMNRTLLEKVRCMLISSGLPKSFWGEALVTAAYLINRSPSVPLNGKIPESMWTGHVIDISSLRVFGCFAFVHQSVDKLEPRSQKCVFIGYPEGKKNIYMQQPAGFVDKSKPDYVCLLKKSLYGLKQSPRYMSNAGPPHWEALKWLLIYLNGSANLGIMFSKCAKGTLLKNGDDDRP